MLISPRSYSSSFQSTLPIREETGQLIFLAVRVVHFNPLFPYGKRRHPWCRLSSTIYISIHSSHTGRDAFRSSAIIWYSLFQSTLPIREETVRQHPVKGACKHFNPLFPYGKRRSRSHSPPAPSRYFNPLFPYGKRRTILLILRLARRISIHSSHTGRDHRNGNI